LQGEGLFWEAECSKGQPLSLFIYHLNRVNTLEFVNVVIVDLDCRMKEWGPQSISSVIILFFFAWLTVMCYFGLRKVGNSRHRDARTLFFVCLIASVVCASPRFIWCVNRGDERSTANCIGTGPIYMLVYSLYAIAMSGFSVCIGIAVCVLDAFILNKDLKISDFRYDTGHGSELPKIILHGAVLCNVIFLFCLLVFFASMKNRAFYNRFDNASTIVYVTYQLTLMSLWCVSTFKLHRLMLDFDRATSLREPLNRPEEATLQRHRERIRYLFGSVVAIFFMNIPRDGLLLWTIDPHAHVNYFVFSLITVILPYILGNFFLVSLMSWPETEENIVDVEKSYSGGDETSAHSVSAAAEAVDTGNRHSTASTGSKRDSIELGNPVGH
jgi:hypothetical protein